MPSPRSTLPGSQEEQNQLNPGQQHYQQVVGQGHVQSGLDQLEAFANDPKNHDQSDDLDSSERGATGAVGGGLYKPSEGGKKERFKLRINKFGAGGALLALLGAGGVFAILSTPALLFLQIQDGVLGAFNNQEVTMSIRQQRLVAARLTSSLTEGSCGAVKIFCRFARPSNAFLANLSKEGIIAVDSKGGQIIKLDRNGNPIKRPGFPNTRPASYHVIQADGTAKIYTAPELVKALNKDPTVQAKFNRAHSPRFYGLSDRVAKNVRKLFGFDKRSSFGGAKDGNEIRDRLTSGSAGEDLGAKAAVELGEEGGEKLVESLLKQYATKVMTVAGKAGKGGAISLVMAGVCLATNIPSGIISITRAYQMGQFIRYASDFLMVPSAMRANSDELTSDVTGTLGGLLTNKVNGKSGMDADGMQYALFDKPTITSDAYKSAIPGYDAMSALGGVAAVTSSPVVQEGCEVALNPATGAAINGFLLLNSGETLGVSAGIAALNWAIGYGLTKVLEAGLPAALDLAAPILAPAFKGVLAALLGDKTANLIGEPVGNALASGAAHMLGQMAVAGGNMPLNISQAVAFDSVKKDVELAQAEQDRATHSPLDATNKNTFMGKMVGSLLPYYDDLGSLSGGIKTMASLPLASLASLVSPVSKAAEDPATQYEQCDLPLINGQFGGEKLAAGMFCNLEYGIPQEYLEMDPLEIVQSLVASGDIDEYTGEPKEKDDGGLADWMAQCTTGDIDFATGCVIKDEKTAMYAVYTVDLRIQRTMDDMDDTGGDGSTGKIAFPAGDGYRVSSGFGPRAAPCSGCSTWHKGIDFTGGTGEVKAFMDGTVVSVGSTGNNVVVVQHANGLISQYLHMFTPDIKVKAGESVTAGQVIGKMGKAGEATGVHLHFEIRIDQVPDKSLYEGFSKSPDGKYINPLEYLRAKGLGT